MADRPILMSGPMMRALLDGRKTQTRRVIKADIPSDADKVFYWPRRERLSDHDVRSGRYAPPGLWARKDGPSDEYLDAIGHTGPKDGWLRHICRCPYGQIGDLLWVREAWSVHEYYNDLAPSELSGEEDVRYDAHGQKRLGRYRPAMFLPRWASRLTLKLTDVRVERVQDIGEADAKAEGAHVSALVPNEWTMTGEGRRHNTPQEAFLTYIKGLNAHRDTAHDNDWVWALSFDVIRANIDQIGGHND